MTLSEIEDAQRAAWVSVLLDLGAQRTVVMAELRRRFHLPWAECERLVNRVAAERSRCGVRGEQRSHVRLWRQRQPE